MDIKNELKEALTILCALNVSGQAVKSIAAIMVKLEKCLHSLEQAPKEEKNG